MPPARSRQGAPAQRPEQNTPSSARTDPTHAAMLVLQRAVGNQAVTSLVTDRQALQRKGKKDAPTVTEVAKAALKASIGGDTAAKCKKKLEGRFPKGPLFTEADLANIQALDSSSEGKKWLKEVGIGTWGEALTYLQGGNFKDWLKQLPGKRLLMATVAYRQGFGADDDNPNPAYTLGRAMAIESGNLSDDERADAEAERDETIRKAFVNTLKGPSDIEKQEVRDTAEDPDAVFAAHAQAQHILTRILLLLQAGLKVYDPKKAEHISYQTGDVVRALAHGGRVNIRIPALSGDNAKDNKYALLNWLGITTGGHKSTGVVKRDYATHHMSIGENKDGPGTGHFKEEGGKSASMANKTASGVNLYGIDLAGGGLGKKDFNGDVILPDGAHGHMFIGFTKPTKKKDGALQIGIETTAPGAHSLVGYKHNWNSTEATANPESTFFGHKMQKVGGGKLETNQRLVDLNALQARFDGEKWTDVLDKLATLWNDALVDAQDEGTEEALYNDLTGRRPVNA